MTMVDNRVVKMTFDNSQFEKNIKNTIQSLKEFEEKLKLKNAAEGIESVGKAADKLNLSVVGDKAKEMAAKLGISTQEAASHIDKIDDNVDKIDFSALSKSMGSEAEKIESTSSEVSKSIDGIDSTVSDISFSPISASADQMSSDVISAIGQIDSEPIISEMSLAEIAFQSLEAVAFGALMNIGDRIMNTVVGWGKSIVNGFVDPIKEGFGEYETQMNSIQTIIANTGMSFDSDEDIAAVNAELDKLNTYADETIYNFTEMTKAIGSFTSSGLNLWDATETVKGVANVAAVAGAQASEMNRALPQIAQALSAGTVTQQDWMSIQTAHMDSRLFVNAIGDMAMHMAEAGLAEENAYEAGRRILEEGANMKALLNKQDSKDIAGWFSSDILSESLRLFTYDRRKMTQEEIDEVEAHLKELGYAEEEFARVFDQAEMAARAATEVRTWTQLKDTIAESIGSNWSGVWRNFIGDFKQATDTFTFLSQTLSGGIDNLFSGIINAFRIFNKYEHEDGTVSRVIEDFWGTYARYEDGENAGKKVVDEVTGDFIRVKGALDYIVEAISKPLGAIKAAFDMVFGISDEELFLTISSLVLAFKDFAESLVISDNAAIGIYETFTGVFTVLKIVIQVVADLIAAFFGFVGFVRSFLDPILDIVLVVFGQIGKVIGWFGERFFQLRASVIEAIYPIIDAIGMVGNAIRVFFGMADFAGSIDSAGDSLIGLLDVIWDFVDLPGKLTALGDFIRFVINSIADMTGWSKAVKESEKALSDTGQEVSVLDIFIQNLLQNPVIAFIVGIIDVIKRLFGFILSIKDGIVGIVSLVGGGLASVVSGVVGSITSGVSGLPDIFNSIIGFFTSTGEETDKTKEKTKSFIDTIKEIGNNSLIQSIVGTIQSVVKAVQDFVTSIDFGKIFSTAINWIKEFGKGFATLVGGGLLTAAGLVWSFVTAVAGLAGRMVDFVKSLDVVQGFFSMLEDAKNNVLGWFMDLPNKLSSLGDALAGEAIPLDPKSNPLLSFVETLRSGIDYLNTVSPEQFLADVIAFFEGIRDNITGFIFYIKNVDVSELVPIIKDKVMKVTSNLLARVREAIEYLKEKFPSLAPIFDKVFKKVCDVISGITNQISGIISKAKEMSSNGPEFIRNLLLLILVVIVKTIKFIFKTVVGLVKVGLFGLLLLIGGIVGIISKFVQNFDINELVDSFGKLFGEIGNAIRDKLGELNPAFRDTFDKIVGFFKGNGEDVVDWGEVVKGALNGVKDFIISIPGKIATAFEKVKNQIAKFAEDVVNNLSKMDNPIGGIFRAIKKKIFDTDDSMKGASKSIPDSLGSITESVKGAVNGIDKDSGVLGRIIELWNQLTGADGRKGSFLETVKNFFGDKAESIVNWLLGLLPAFGDMLDKLIDCFSSDRVSNIVTIIGNIAKARMLWGMYDLFKGLGRLSSAVAKKISPPKEVKNFTRIIAEWTIALAILAGALWVISTIPDPWKCVGVLASLGALLLALSGLATLLDYVAKTHGLSGGGGRDLLAASLSLVVLIGAMILFTKAVEVLTAFDFEANTRGIIAACAMLTVFGLYLAGLSHILGNGGKNAIKVAAAIGIMILELWLLIPVIQKINDLTKGMSDDDLSRVAIAMIAIGAFLLAIGGAIRLASAEHPLAAAVGILLVAAAISIMGDAIEKVAKCDPYSAGQAMAGFILLLATFGALTLFFKPKELIGVSAAILIFSGAMVVLAYGIGILAENDWTGIAAAGGALIVLMAALGIMTALLKPKDLVLISAGLLVFSVAVGVMAFGLTQLANIDSGNVLAAAGALFAIMAALTIATAVLSAPGISEAAMIILPLLSLAFIALGAACIMIAYALNLTVQAIVGLAMVAPLLVGFVTVVAANAGSFLLAAVGLAALGVALIPFGIGATLAGAGLILLSQGIRDFLLLIIQLPILLEAAGNSLPTVLTMIWEGICAWWDSITTWIFETAIPAVGEWLANTLSTIGEKWEAIKAWWSTNIWPMLSEAIGKFVNWVQTEGLPRAGEFVLGLLGKAGELKDKFLAWLQSDGIPMLQKAGADFMNWVETDGIPKLIEFGGKLKDWLIERKDKFLEWIRTDGVQMARDALDELVKKAGEFKDDLIDWAKKIPGWARDGVDQMLTDLGNVGDYIAQGIANGLGDGYKWITNAINGLGDWALNGIKDFFGIASPSKLMRDEVGVYIPAGIGEGIIQNAKAVVDAAESVASDAVSAASNALRGADLSSVSPEITPVMDIDNFGYAVDEYNKMVQRTMSGADLVSSGSFKADIGVDSLSSSLAYAIDEDINRLKEVESTLGDIAEAITTSNKLYTETNSTLGLLTDNTSSINERLKSGTGLYLDSGTLVGLLAPEMDRALGRRMSLAGRGVY